MVAERAERGNWRYRDRIDQGLFGANHLTLRHNVGIYSPGWGIEVPRRNKNACAVSPNAPRPQNKYIVFVLECSSRTVTKSHVA
jgi:hypothetical protein